MHVLRTTKHKAHSFRGGLALPPNKRALTHSLVDIALPSTLYFPLLDYNKAAVQPDVSVGDYVFRGQTLAKGIIASSSGTITHIQPRSFAHPGNLSTTALVLNCDGQDQTIVSEQLCKTSAKDRLQQFIEQPLKLIEQAAITGLGGAGFPTAQKIQAWARAKSSRVSTLIINAAECEPEIACDETLIRTSSSEIISGIAAVMQALEPSNCVIAIEDSKTAAIEALSNSLEHANHNIELLIIPTRYPVGAEPMLIKTVLGKSVPANQSPASQGTLCINVATIHAIWQAINGIAFDTRIVSLGGESMPHPCNVRVRFGTPIDFVLSQTGNESALNGSRLRTGGPLSGFELLDTSSPVTAKINCILAAPKKQSITAQPCIRCGLCADVCPAALLPQQLYRYTQANETSMFKPLNLDSCIECGCCDLVCPSSITLTDTFRYAKSIQREQLKQDENAQVAERRFDRREVRVRLRQEAKKKAIEDRKQALKDNQHLDSKVSDTLARLKAQRESNRRK